MQKIDLLYQEYTNLNINDFGATKLQIFANQVNWFYIGSKLF
jgi:hypothetical protein